jgi:hypothetical protein
MSQYGWHNCPTEIETQVHYLTQNLTGLLADNLIGVYLHGSLTMHCFNPEGSDLDLLVITKYSIPLDTKRQLAELLLSTSCAPQPIEINFLPHSVLVPWQYPTPYDYHYSETWREPTQYDLQNGGWRHWNAHVLKDPDLAAHITITVHRGISLYGTPIAHVFPLVPRDDYLASILEDVKGALDDIMEDNPVYAILNTCRVYAFLHDGLICSKQEGGLWALAVVPKEIQPVIAMALEEYATAPQTTQFDSMVVAAFVSYMQQQLP